MKSTIEESGKPLSENEKLELTHKVYTETQTLSLSKTAADKQQLSSMNENWKDENISALQKKVVNQQLSNLADGIVDPVFILLIDVLNKLEINNISLLHVH